MTREFLSLNTLKVEELFNPVRGVRDQAIRDGKVPVDHAKKNRKAIAEASKRNALLKAV